jgi:hypothetical protein
VLLINRRTFPPPTLPPAPPNPNRPNH